MRAKRNASDDARVFRVGLPSRETNPNAETYDLSVWGLRAVPQFGRCSVRKTRRRGRDFHAHPYFQITVCTQGVMAFERPDGSVWRLTPGRMLVLPPNETHRLLENSHGSCRFWFFVESSLSAQSFRGLCSEEADSLSRALHGLDSRLYHLSPATMKIPNELYERVSARGKQTWISRLEVRELVLRFLLDILDAEPVGNRVATPIGPLIARMRLHPEEDWPIARLNGEARCSPPTLMNLFRRETGKTPHSFLLSCRIGRAKELLKAGRRIGEIAHALGFSSSQHFSTAFLRETGMSPTEIVKKNKVKNN